MRHRFPLLLIFAFGAALLALTRSPAGAPGPQSFAEVLALAEARGLYACTDCSWGGGEHRVYLSDRPLDRAAVNSLPFGAPHYPGWIGRVAVELHWRDSLVDPGCPDHTARWGAFLLFGDATLIRQLLAADGG